MLSSSPGHARWGSPVHRTAPVVALCIVLMGGAPRCGFSQERTSPSTPPTLETFERLVSELIRLEREEVAETTAWREQSGDLDAMVTALESERKRLDTASADVEAREKAAQSEHERTAERIRAANERLSRLARAATEAARGILAEYDGLPISLQEQLRGGATIVRSLFADDVPPDGAVEALRTVLAFCHDMQRIASDVHVVKEVLTFAEGRRREVDMLYLGTAMGFYLTPDRRQAGMVLRSGGVWTRSDRDDVAPYVALALEVRRRETPPRLVPLPLCAPVTAAER